MLEERTTVQNIDSNNKILVENSTNVIGTFLNLGSYRTLKLLLFFYLFIAQINTEDADERDPNNLTSMKTRSKNKSMYSIWVNVNFRLT